MKVREKLASRTYWLCWGIVLLATYLAQAGTLDGAGWVTATAGVLIAWQSRRAYDNKLKANHPDQ